MTQTLLKLPATTIESVFNYRLPGHKIDSKCYLRFYLANNSQAKQIIILTELKDNSGASIANCAEYLPGQLKEFLRQNYDIELAEDAIFIEHYEADYYGDGEDERFALFDRSGKFQHLSVDRLKLIFDESYTTNWSAIALLDSWASDGADEEEQKETWEFLDRHLRHSPFVVPQIELWTIYQNLPDYPNKFVALKFITSTRTDELIIRDSLEDIREILEKEGRRRIEPNYDEEPTVIEIWI
jgi:hypothetical protein